MKKHRKMWLTVGMILFAAMVFWLWPRPLAVTRYEITADVTEPIRIVQLSDLHGRQLGENNGELIACVSKQEPDLIFMTGDMISRDETELTPLCELVSALSELAPVYYSYGNHEVEWMTTHDVDLEKRLTDAGADVLELEYRDLTVNGQELRIGGYYGYYRTPQMETKDKELRAKKLAFADDFENTERQKLLLAHIPTSWLDWERVNDHPVGVVFCGHYHGGQVRIPILNIGLYAPYVGWFPTYTKGAFVGEKAVCVLSAGLGAQAGLPRIYDPPELVTVVLTPRD